jgi:hypothetical protein
VSFLDSNSQGTSISIIKSPGVKIRDKKILLLEQKRRRKKEYNNIWVYLIVINVII